VFAVAAPIAVRSVREFVQRPSIHLKAFKHASTFPPKQPCGNPAVRLFYPSFFHNCLFRGTSICAMMGVFPALCLNFLAFRD